MWQPWLQHQDASERAVSKTRANPRLRSWMAEEGLCPRQRVLCVSGLCVFKPLFFPYYLGKPLLSFCKSSSACLVPEAEHASSIKLTYEVLQNLNSLNFIILGRVCLVTGVGQSRRNLRRGKDGLCFCFLTHRGEDWSSSRGPTFKLFSCKKWDCSNFPAWVTGVKNRLDRKRASSLDL